MSNSRKTAKDSTAEPMKREKLPPKGTAARALHAAGLWSHMSKEEIDRIRQDIYSSRRSAG